MPPAIELDSIRKDYRGLRPLRIRHLAVAENEAVALQGLDAAAAEALTNVITGATLPDEGVVRVLGRDTGTIVDADQWLASLDVFGIVSDRAALVDGLTLRQNVAIALTLEVDPVPDELAAVVAALAQEAGLPSDRLDVAAGAAPPSDRFRARLGRAIALSPRILLAEHPAASLPRDSVSSAAADFFRLVRKRRLAALVVSADPAFNRDADRQLTLDPATGALQRRRPRAWFS